MRSFELVIFDCDGVLVDSETITNGLMIEMLKPYGIEFTRTEYVIRYVGMTLESCLRLLRNEYKVSFSENFLAVYHTKSLELLKKNVKEVDGVRQLIERLHVPFCVASNSSESKVKLMLEATDLYRYFTGKIFSASLVAKPKPSPDVYLMAAKAHNIRPENCLVIEDTPTGIQAGKAAGMVVYGYVGLFTRRALQEAGADELFQHMDQVSVAGSSVKLNAVM